MYFKNVKTLEDLKKMYRELVKANHPDHGGDPEVMKAINNEYDIRFQQLKDKHNAESDEAHQCTETPEEFREIIEKLIVIDDIVIELCGSWVWISGNTYGHRDELKSIGCMFAPKKKMWYWRHPEDAACGKHRTKTIDEIRARYGSTVIENISRQTARLAAAV